MLMYPPPKASCRAPGQLHICWPVACYLLSCGMFMYGFGGYFSMPGLATPSGGNIGQNIPKMKKVKKSKNATPCFDFGFGLSVVDLPPPGSI